MVLLPIWMPLPMFLLVGVSVSGNLFFLGVSGQGGLCQGGVYVKGGVCVKVAGPLSGVSLSR